MFSVWLSVWLVTFLVLPSLLGILTPFAASAAHPGTLQIAANSSPTSSMHHPPSQHAPPIQLD